MVTGQGDGAEHDGQHGGGGRQGDQQ